MKRNYYVLMGSAVLAMQLYQIMEKDGIKATLAPTPRTADHCCGVSILYYDESDREKIVELAENNQIEIDGFHDCDNTDNPNRHKYC